MNLEIVALVIMIFVVLVLFYGIIAIHDIPYEIAKERDHPHLEAIHYAGWVSMFTLHAIWPFLWIWATIYHKDKGYGFGNAEHDLKNLSESVARLEARVAAVEAVPANTVSAPSSSTRRAADGSNTPAAQKAQKPQKKTAKRVAKEA